MHCDLCEAKTNDHTKLELAYYNNATIPPPGGFPGSAIKGTREHFVTRGKVAIFTPS
jgi:hypothetical protein